jgi:TetR/AcrR family transcriptional regulator, cholesterol catabolism regulator
VAGRRSTEISSRKAEILSAAAELFAKHGFAGTSVRDIANACGILSGSIYHHFSAKEELVEEIFTAYFDELTARWDVVLAEPWDARTKLEAMLRAAIENVDRHTAAARLFTHEWLDLRHVGYCEARWDEIQSMWLRLLRAGERDGSFRSDIDPALLFSVAMDAIRGLSGWYHQGHRYSIETLSDAYIGVLMTGIVTAAKQGDPRRPVKLVGPAKAIRPDRAAKATTRRSTKVTETAKKAKTASPVRRGAAKR